MFVLRRQNTIRKEQYRKRQRSASNVELPVVMVKHQKDELHREADEEENIELHDANENLIMREHPFDLSICPETLVDLPTKLSPYLPA